jgi:NADH-ubiquinone oxidoreductase chain 4
MLNIFNNKQKWVYDIILLVIPTVLFGIYPAAILDGVHYSVSTLIYALDFCY